LEIGNWKLINMTIKDIFSETITSLSANKVRSGLTVLGIVIGISSVIAMTAIGEGAIWTNNGRCGIDYT
jgi:hypothetical protein